MPPVSDRGPDMERFERWAPRFDRSPLQLTYFRPIHRTLGAALSPAGGARVLDVGCGTGNLSLRLTERGAIVVGVDPARAMVTRARAKAAALLARSSGASSPPPPRFLVAAAEHLPFADGAFDAAVSSISVHHWADPRGGFVELHRVIRPGGRVAVADMRAHGFIRVRIQRRLHPGHHEGWTVGELSDLLGEAGFRRVRRWTRWWWLGRFAVVLAADRDDGTGSQPDPG
jgi:ubiquinone/menaquinone biosynthesis C-methylase UbiE